MVENINNPQSVRVVDTYNQTVAVYDAAKQKITGYENQVYASYSPCHMPKRFVSCSKWMLCTKNGEYLRR